MSSRRRTDRLAAAGPDGRAAGNPGVTPHDRDAGAPARRGLRGSPVQRASPPPGHHQPYPHTARRPASHSCN